MEKINKDNKDIYQCDENTVQFYVGSCQTVVRDAGSPLGRLIGVNVDNTRIACSTTEGRLCQNGYIIVGRGSTEARTRLEWELSCYGINPKFRET